MALIAVVLQVAAAALLPVPVQGSECEIWCLDLQGLCPPGQAMNIGRRQTSFYTCCIGCGGVCLPISECKFGPSGCNQFCAF